MDNKVLGTLPVLNQTDFPALPQIPDGVTLLIFNSGWQNAEKEWAAGIIIAYCSRAGAWKPMSWQEFSESLRHHPLAFDKSDVVTAVRLLIDSGQLDFVQVEETQYLVPTLEMANIALAKSNTFRVM